MMNINSISTVANISTKGTALNKTALEQHENPKVNTGASSIVDLKSGISKTEAKGTVTVDKSNAMSMANDIASLLAKSTGKIQANISAFDAASLLA